MFDIRDSAFGVSVELLRSYTNDEHRTSNIEHRAVPVGLEPTTLPLTAGGTTVVLRDNQSGWSDLNRRSPAPQLADFQAFLHPELGSCTSRLSSFLALHLRTSGGRRSRTYSFGFHAEIIRWFVCSCRWVRIPERPEGFEPSHPPWQGGRLPDYIMDATGSCKSPQPELPDPAARSQVWRELISSLYAAFVVQSSGGWGRATDLPLFKRTLLPSELHRI